MPTCCGRAQHLLLQHLRQHLHDGGVLVATRLLVLVLLRLLLHLQARQAVCQLGGVAYILLAATVARHIVCQLQ